MPEGGAEKRCRKEEPEADLIFLPDPDSCKTRTVDVVITSFRNTPYSRVPAFSIV